MQAPSLVGESASVDATLDALRARGAHGFDPVRFRYIEALARRAAAHGSDVRRTLDHKLVQALAAYGEQYETARSEADEALPGLTQRFADAAGDLRRLHAGSDFRALRRLAARLEAQARRGPLADLVDAIDRHASAQGEGTTTQAAAAPFGPPAELNALRRFRSTWDRLSVDQQLKRSLAKIPENPGPLNSHLLMLRSLRLMQAVSPAYLSRFMSHAEALLWLDQASLGSAPVRGKPVGRESDKKRKPGRGKGG